MTLTPPRRGRAAQYLADQLAHGDRSSGCWEWPFNRNTRGYGHLSIGGRMQMVHRLAFEREHGFAPQVCRHTCDNRSCFNPAHLLNGTYADNSRDMVERGRSRRGPLQRKAKLTEAEVLEIRRAHAAGEAPSISALARQFGHRREAVSSVIARKSWAWLEGPEAGRFTLAAAVAMLLLAAGAIVTVLAFTPRAGAQGVAGPVSYQVGDVLVFASSTRNDSCSVTRVVRNTSDQPLRVIASATWPGQPVHLPPNQGSLDGDDVLAPGAQATAVWTNSGYVTDGPLNLTWTVLIPDGVAQIGANRLEAVPACNPTPESPQTSTSAVPPVASSAPPTTGPPPSTAQTVVSTPEHSPPPGVETTTTAPTGVLTSSHPRLELPATGDRTGPAIVLAGALLAVGALAWAAGRHLGRISDTYPPADNEDGQP